MKKKRLLVTILILIAITAMLGWVWRHKVEESSVENVAQEAGQDIAGTPQTDSQANLSTTNQRPTSVQRSPTTNSSSGSDAMRLYVQNLMADPEYEGKQPINFYGKVIDESNQPITGATVIFVWTDLSTNGTSETQIVSDASGFFSLLDRKGKHLSVTASKVGYYTPRGEARMSFEFANPADGLFTPDANNPVVFHLRKKGSGTDLVTSQYGVKSYFGVTVPLDETPVYVDLFERKTGASGQMKVSQKKPPANEWKEATEWFFRMEIPDGGFVEQNDEFPFEAPENGYESVIEFQFRKGEANWAEGIKKDYYIKFGNPPRYGLLNLKTLIEMEGARFTYAINPDGSRYLEPKN